MLWPVSEMEQRQAMSKMWAIFPVGPDDPIHLRAIWGKGVPNPQPTQNITFNARAYPNVIDRQRAFEDEAIRLNGCRYNIYTVFNRIDPSFAGDEHNRLAVKDEHIAARRYLLIDVDRPATHEPATDNEVDNVWKAAHRIEQDFFFSKGEEPISVGSGNGAHIYLPLANLQNDAATKELCKRTLLALANKYNTPTAHVDTSVFNASRITKVPGTVARKGIEVRDYTGINERYYRMASVIE